MLETVKFDLKISVNFWWVLNSFREHEISIPRNSLNFQNREPKFDEQQQGEQEEELKKNHEKQAEQDEQNQEHE